MKKIRKKMRLVPISLALLSVFALYFVVSGNNSFYQTSVVSLPEHKAFDGTVYPVSLVPNYVKLKADRLKLPFDSYTSSELIPIMKYNAEDLKKNLSDLIWGNAEHDSIRNSKITYSTPYMGNYKLDGVENAGSHLAVDIKIPNGTPIYSIANGVVVKVSQQDSGFGKHIVVMHKNVPSIVDSTAKTVLYSSYSHLSQTNVSVNDIVLKGQMIAKSGDTGTVTTPHLHFQIDNDNAPWHPYWPFTWKEASDSGLDFFSAVNAGLGKDKALATTINPMLYVQKYLNSSNTNTDSSDDSVFNTKPIIETKPEASVVTDLRPPVLVESETPNSYIPDVKKEIIESTEIVGIIEENTLPVIEPVVVEEPVLNFVFDVLPIYYYENRDLTFKLSLKDQFAKDFKNGFSGDLLISSVNDNMRISSPLINFMSFSNGNTLNKKFVVRSSGKDRLKIVYDGNTYYSDWFELVKVEKDALFKDVSAKSKFHESLLYLTEKGVVNGYDDGTFKPSNNVSRVEALKLVLKSNDVNLKKGSVNFKDTDNKEWYSEFLYTAVENGIVNGYADGTFKPENSVSKAEFYKILLSTAGINVDERVSSSPFVDVKTNDWFAPYFAKAYELEIIDKEMKFVSPNDPISRGESAYAIFKAIISR